MKQKPALLCLHFPPQDLQQIQTWLCKLLLDLRKKNLQYFPFCSPKPGEVPFHRLSICLISEEEKERDSSASGQIHRIPNYSTHMVPFPIQTIFLLSSPAQTTELWFPLELPQPWAVLWSCFMTMCWGKERTLINIYLN